MGNAKSVLTRAAARMLRITHYPLPVTPAWTAKRIFASAAAALLAAAPVAQGADLLDVYRQARESDAVYAAARATWAATQEKLVQGRAGLLPQASLSASTQQNDRDLRFRTPGATGGSTEFNSNVLTLNITQPLYRKQNLVVYQQAQTQVEQADAVLALAGQDLMLRVAQAYFDVLLAQDSVAFAQAQKTAIAEQLAQAKRNFEVGTATITDTHEAQARFDLTVAQEIAAQNDLEIRRRQLAQLIGRDAPELARLGKQVPLALPEPDRIEVWVEQAVRTSLSVQQAEAALALAGQEIERTRGGHHPTLDAFATYSDSGSGASSAGATGGGTDITTRVLGLQLAIPLYQGGGTTSRVREALALRDKARQDLENARRAAELASRQGFLGVVNGSAQLKALQAALVSSQSSLDSTRLGREVGVRTQVDVLNAQQQLFSTRRDLAQATYNYLLSLLRLKAAVGTLSEEDFVKINTWLERK